MVPELSKHGLVHIQTNDYENNQVRVITTLYHSSGEWVRGVLPVLARNLSDPKALGSAITYARRYALCGILGISADADDDGDAAQQGQSNNSNHGAGYKKKVNQSNSKKPTLQELINRALKDHPKITVETVLEKTDYCVDEGDWEGKAIDKVPEWQNLVVNSIRAEARDQPIVDVLLKFNGEQRAIILQAQRAHKERHDAKAQAKSYENRGKHQALQKQIAGK